MTLNHQVSHIEQMRKLTHLFLSTRFLINNRRHPNRHRRPSHRA